MDAIFVFWIVVASIVGGVAFDALPGRREPLAPDPPGNEAGGKEE